MVALCTPSAEGARTAAPRQRLHRDFRVPDPEEGLGHLLQGGGGPWIAQEGSRELGSSEVSLPLQSIWAMPQGSVISVTPLDVWKVRIFLRQWGEFCLGGRLDYVDAMDSSPHCFDSEILSVTKAKQASLVTNFLHLMYLYLDFTVFSIYIRKHLFALNMYLHRSMI